MQPGRGPVQRVPEVGVEDLLGVRGQGQEGDRAHRDQRRQQHDAQRPGPAPGQRAAPAAPGQDQRRGPEEDRRLGHPGERRNSAATAEYQPASAAIVQPAAARVGGQQDEHHRQRVGPDVGGVAQEERLRGQHEHREHADQAGALPPQQRRDEDERADAGQRRFETLAELAHAEEVLEQPPEQMSGHVEVHWRQLVANRSVWLLSVQYFCLIFSWIFYITWLPTYLHDYHHQAAEAAARLAVIPLMCGGIGCAAAGFIVPRLAQALGSLAKARRLIATTGLVGAACFLVVATRLSDPLLCVLAMGAASFSNDLDTPPSWNAAMDVGGKYAGTVAGWMATGGHTAAVIAPAVGGYLLQRTHGDWNLFLYVMAAIFAAGALCWQFIDPVTPVEVAE